MILEYLEIVIFHIFNCSLSAVHTPLLKHTKGSNLCYFTRALLNLSIPLVYLPCKLPSPLQHPLSLRLSPLMYLRLKLSQMHGY